MPRYNIEPRLSGRDKRLAQLGQMQESDQRQQQADAAQQNAMLGQVAQLYGLQNAQEEQTRLGELHPMHMQQLQDAHDAAQWGLQNQQTLAPAQLAELQAQTQGQQEHTHHAQEMAPGELAAQGTHEQLTHEQIAALQQENKFAPQEHQLKQDIGHAAIGQDTAAQRHLDAGTIQLTNTTNTQPSTATLETLWKGHPMAELIHGQGATQAKGREAELARLGLTPQAPNTSTSQIPEESNPYLLRGLADIIGGPMDFTNKLTNDFIAGPYDWLSKGVGSKSRMKRLPTHGGSNAVRKSFGLQQTQ